MIPAAVDPATGPADLADVLTLAGVVIFFITSLSAVLSSIFVKRDNLLYLGTQLVLLALFLHLSTHWTYTAWFSDVFRDARAQQRVADTVLLLAIAYTLDMGIKILVWEGMLARHGKQSVPPLLMGSVRVLIYLFAFLVVLQFVFDKSITALAALSGAFALIVGLSAQTTLGEMFAGIAIALSRPFHIGDWVKIGTLDEGRVVDMTWRMVRIETRDRIVLNVPNRAVADQPVRNFSHPNRAVRITEAIYFPQEADPTAVQALLREAVAGAEGVLRDPAASVLYRGAKEGVSEYSLRFYIDDYKDKDNVIEAVWKSVLDGVARSKVRIAFPRRYLEISSEPVAARAS
jgi:branched-chain amino acid transport system substrate-binding protein